MNIVPSLGIDINAKQETATALCFHPHKNILNIASGNEIFVCDLTSKHVIGKVSIDSEPSAIITHLYQPLSHNYLVAATDVGSMYVWEMNRRTLVSEHHDVEKKPLACITGSSLLPIIFFSRVSSRDVSGIDLRPANISNANLKFKGSKKNVLSLACHPTKHILATTGQDGVVKVWDYQTQSLINTIDDVMTYETNKVVTAGDRYMVAFEPRDSMTPSRLICVGSNGVLLGWSDFSGDQPKLSFSCQLKIKSKIVNIAFHPTLPILITLMANGSICGWEPWQSEFLPSGCLTEFSLLPHESNKFSHLPSYAQRPPFSGAPTQLFVHPSAKYFTFLWDTSSLVTSSSSHAQPLTQSLSTGSLPTVNSTLHSSPSVPNFSKNSSSLSLSISSALSPSTRTPATINTASSPVRPTNPLSISGSAIPRPILSSPSTSSSSLSPSPNTSLSPIPSPLAHRQNLSSSAPLRLMHTNSSAAIIMTASPPPPPSVAQVAAQNAGSSNAGAAQNAGGAIAGAGNAIAGSGGLISSSNAAIALANLSVKRITVRQLIYTHTDTFQPLTTLPLVSPMQPQPGFFYDEKQSFSFPRDAVYFDNNSAMAHYFIKGVSVKLLDLPPPKGDTARDLVRPIRFVYSPKQQGYLVFYEISRFNSGGENYKCLIALPNLGFSNQYEIAQDGVFAGHDEDTMVLLVGGTHVHISSVTFLEWRIVKLDTVVSRIFKTPFGSGNVVLYFDKKERRLIYSHPETYLPDPSKGFLSLQEGEHVVQVVWQGEVLAAVLTTSRLIVMNSKFEIVAQVEERPANYPLITSIMWLEWVLLYTTDTHLKYLTLDGKVFTLRSLDRDKIVLSALLPDRVLYGARNVTSPHDPEAPHAPSVNTGFGLGAWATTTGNVSVGLGGSTTVHQHAVGLLEPLLMGLFAPPVNAPVENLKAKISFVISRFDTGRVTKRLLDRLLEVGHPDAAFQLTENSTRYAPDYRYSLAFNAKFYDKAFSIASAEYEKTKDARYRARLLAVGQASMEDKKFDLARKAFELANDTFALLNLYVVSNHKAGLELLRSVAEEQADKFTIVLIDKILAKSIAQNPNAMTDSPFAPLLYSPTHFINVSMRMGGEFLSPLNLNSLSRWLTTSNAATISAVSQQQISTNTTSTRLTWRNSGPFAQQPPLQPPTATTTTNEKVENPRSVPPKRFGSLRANQQALSTKTTLAASSTLRRTPSFERVVNLPVLPKRPLEELLVDDEEDPPKIFNGKQEPNDVSTTLNHTATPTTIIATLTSTTNAEVPTPSSLPCDSSKDDLPTIASTDLNKLSTDDPSSTLNPSSLVNGDEVPLLTGASSFNNVPLDESSSNNLNSTPPDHLIDQPSSAKEKEELIEDTPTLIPPLKLPPHDDNLQANLQENPTAIKDHVALRGDSNPFNTINAHNANLTPAYFSSFPPPLPMSHFVQAAAQPVPSTLGIDPDTQAKFQEYEQPNKTNKKKRNETKEKNRKGKRIKRKKKKRKKRKRKKEKKEEEREKLKKKCRATERVQLAMESLEKGAYTESLENISIAAKLLTAVTKPELYQRELRLCTAYALGLRLLEVIKEEEYVEGKEHYVARLRLPLQPKHRVVILRMASNKNLAIENYNTAAKILELLMALELPDQAISKGKWQTCKDKTFSEAVSFPSFRNLCFKTLDPLSPPINVCNLCLSTFSPSIVPTGSKCPYCSNGTLQLNS